MGSIARTKAHGGDPGKANETVDTDGSGDRGRAAVTSVRGGASVLED